MNHLFRGSRLAIVIKSAFKCRVVATATLREILKRNSQMTQYIVTQ